ncbi:MAG: NAD(P)/FAD-dependent oxidoreductase [Acutalibacteraceae bacterium]
MSGTESNVLIIGAGAAGTFAAITAADNGAHVALIEKNEKIGRKLLITGKGRCNITNNCTPDELIANVPTNGRFLYSAVNSFTPTDTIGFFEQNGLKTKTERGRRVFPESDKAMDVVDTLFAAIKRRNCKLINDTVKSLIIEDNTVKGVKTVKGKAIFANTVIIACGGKSYPGTGSTGDGYMLAQQAGHTVITPKASLVPIVSSDEFCKELQGLSLKNVSICVVANKNNKVIYNDFGEMLFTHFGISGPLILSASAHMKNIYKGAYTVKIDLKPALSEQQLDVRLQRDFSKNLNKDIINSLGELLPHKLIPVIVALSGIPTDTKCHSVTKEQRSRLVELLKALPVSADGFRPIEEAIITSGGVKVSEIKPNTMESKLVKGLYFAGEVIDVDAYTGGYNLQIAFSTGHLAGQCAAWAALSGE